jgi:cysteine-S-conjugate beta-lyase
MSRNGELNRRAFLKNAGITAIAGAAGTLSSTAVQAAPAPHARMSGGKYDFDTVYNRVGSNCSRWDGAAAPYPEGVFKYGMGVASQDFECAPCITEALHERVNHHNWGYMAGAQTDTLKEAIIQWKGERNSLDLYPGSITVSDGVYAGMIAAMRAFSPPGSKALIMTPAYSGFYSMARGANIGTVDSQMKIVNGRYEPDWADLESKMTSDIRVLIVCNPQNPTGNVWRADELERMGRLALDNDIVVLSDEIHCDVIRRDHKFTPFGSLSDRAVVDNSITFTAISKTFNMAGLKNAYYYSSNPSLLGRVDQYHRAELSTLGMVATEAAYRDGGDWFDQANDYMDDNHQFIEDYVKANLPDVGYTRNEGTYMTFLDFSKVIDALGAEELQAMYDSSTPDRAFREWLVYNSGVYLNPGSAYGAGGEGHVRLNVASSRIILNEAFDAITAAIRNA